MTREDAFGNPVSTTTQAGERAVRDFAEGFAACDLRVLGVLAAAADDPSVIVQACAAMLHMFSESAAGPAQARPYLVRALADDAPPATLRERLFAQAIAAWADDDLTRAIALHRRILAEHPRDLTSLKLVHYHCFNLGDSPAMLRLALPSARAAADVAYVHGMTAFAYEQCHLLDEAEASARRAIGLQRKEPWAHHALAHVLLTQGRLHEGRTFLDSVSDTWTGLNSFMVTHLWWHQCLFMIEDEDYDAVLAMYEPRIWGEVKTYSQDQIGAVSLLARLELSGVPVGDRWQDLGRHLAARGYDHVQPFLDMQYLYGLARAGRPEADGLLADIERHANETAAPLVREAWQQVCVPASRGLLAHARGDHRGAIDGLGQALPRLLEIGGSHAQRDLFEQMLIDSLLHESRLVAVHNVLQPRAHAMRESRRFARRLRELHERLGLPTGASSH